jgi:hypothetical protein
MRKLIAVVLLFVFRVAFAACPDPEALKLFRERIAFERTGAEPSYKVLNVMHLNVWSSGRATGFYIRDPMGGNFSPRIRDTYVFVGNDGLRAGGTCDIAKNWTDCLRKFAGAGDAPATTCQITIDLHSIPAWRPSPNNEVKKQAADQMRREIEAWYPNATEIVARDFNLLDHAITFYAKTPDGDYCQGVSYYADKVPHCEGWHLFGMAPLSSVRKWIFARPYRLK